MVFGHFDVEDGREGSVNVSSPPMGGGRFRECFEPGNAYRDRSVVQCHELS